MTHACLITLPALPPPQLQIFCPGGDWIGGSIEHDGYLRIDHVNVLFSTCSVSRLSTQLPLSPRTCGEVL